MFFPIVHQPGQTVVQGRLSLNVCPNHFIFHGMVWNEITKFRVICFFKKWFGTEFRTFLSSAELFRTNFRAFSVPRNRQNSDGMNQNFRLFRVPRNNFFLGKWQPYAEVYKLERGLLSKNVSYIDFRPNMPCSLAWLVAGCNPLGGGSLWYWTDCGT